MTSNEPSPGVPQGSSNSPGSAPAQVNSAESEQYQAVRELAMQINDTTSVGKSCSMSKAIVQSVQNVSGQITVTIGLSGDTTPIAGVRIYDWYSPVVGDTVDVLLQDNDIVVIGRKNIPTTTVAANGWITPSLTSGVTPISGDPVRWRVINDNGDRKIQLRGGVNLNSTQTLMWTMPADARPAADKPAILVARDVAGGSVVAGLQVNANGTLTLSGVTTGVRGTATGAEGGFSGNVSTTQHGNLAGTYVSVSHYHNNLGPSDGGIDYAGGNPHYHITNSATHTHSITVGDHTHALLQVLHPDAISFNGIEYFL